MSSTSRVGAGRSGTGSGRARFARDPAAPAPARHDAKLRIPPRAAGNTAPVLRHPGPDHSPDHPPLRLVGAESADALSSGPQVAQPARLLADATDPRWVLAVRTSEQLEGTLLRPEKRQRLIRLGCVMGLTAFDCNLVIAIIQDQARRGHAAQDCPAAAAGQLQMVPVPHRATILSRLRARPGLFVAGLLVTMVVLEVALLKWVF